MWVSLVVRSVTKAEHPGELESLQLGAALADGLHVHELEPLQAEAVELVAELLEHRHDVLVEVDRVLGEGGVAQLERGEGGEDPEGGEAGAGEVAPQDGETLQAGELLGTVLEGGQQTSLGR